MDPATSPTRSATAEGKRYPPISDYAIIGDCRSAALVSSAGSIEWLCWPRFDSASIFAAILDADRGGRFRISPTGNFETRRRYLDDSNVLETRFHTDGGELRLVDFMPVASEAEKCERLVADHRIVRMLECVGGEVEVEVLFDPHPDYGKRRTRLERRGALGFFHAHDAGVLCLQSDLPLELEAGAERIGARVRLREGERRWITLSFTRGAPAILSPPEYPEAALSRSLAWWHGWISALNYEGPHVEAVKRSALVLKLMAFSPSGAIIAAPTSSLPERVGGSDNWDYRFCWLRDASFTVRALLELGFVLEAGAFLAWLLHATRLTWPELHVLYDVYGGTHTAERQLDYLEGYRGSRPVRVGNAARKQLQLDVYGEVADAAIRYVSHGGHLDARSTRILVGFGDTVCRLWRQPDEGIWEERTSPQQHTYSKAMCWVALNRLLQLHERGHVDAPVAKFRRECDAIRQAVEKEGFNPELGSYVGVFGGSEVDASLLQLANVQFLDPASPRMLGTLRLIRERLGRGPLLFRTEMDAGPPPDQGTFGICSFWEVEARARAGDVDGALAQLDALLGYANDVGLFAEEIDATSGAALGNFPQAFTHIGLINAAVTIGKKLGVHRKPMIAGRVEEKETHV